MKIHHHLQTPVADRATVKWLPLKDHSSEEDNRDFLDFIESISLSSEEMAAFIGAPDSSIAEIRR